MHKVKKPQYSGICKKIYNMTPKKPNSALRKVAQVITRYGTVIAYIPGQGHSLQPHSKVLIRHGRKRDLPGVKFTIIRGVADFKGDFTKRNSRSKYGLNKLGMKLWADSFAASTKKK